MSRYLGPLTVIALTSIAGCAKGPTEATRGGGEMSVQSHASMPRTIDDDFADLTLVLPGFGGLFYDSAGVLTVNLVQSTELDHARSVIRDFLIRRGAVSTARRNRASLEASVMRAREVKYDFRYLLSLYRQYVVPLVGVSGAIAMTDVNDARNLIVVGVRSAEQIRQVQQLIAAVPIPEDAIEVIAWGPVEE